jgi:hypothetical protein
MQQKIRTIKRRNGMWVAYEAGKNFLAQAKTKAKAKLLFALGHYNLKD